LLVETGVRGPNNAEDSGENEERGPGLAALTLGSIELLPPPQPAFRS